MDADITYQGRIGLEPAMSVEWWIQHLDHHLDFASINPRAYPTLAPVLIPVLSQDERTVIAVKPGALGTDHAVMVISLRRLAHLAALANEDGCVARMTGQFTGIGDEGEQYTVHVRNDDLVVHATALPPGSTGGGRP
ncbi:hypothetical protein [Glycomyces sp. MUSA5-2]|uniref:hypothetical protein n=1 Tax=Glycomyces sp. MUSA5-2 TaxID=2053002 RepID=UPI0030098628